ncbi:hypothetical protein [Streptantibioticus ferralitis]|uniref:Secreted protein n=1 Tax=Streptantibioticus ferralitis TaxID=236510 RepID=A0ABT5YY93_9ACTN|nr:hypothetical protein [Streptantibioticus ferralitis]MDF2256564.1 hypothetical protein [Streptantibioticus ferralitis]
MIRRVVASAVVGAGMLGTVLLASGTASAADFVPGGVYPSLSACADAGNAGFPEGRWVGWNCQPLGDGQFELWVQPTY